MTQAGRHFLQNVATGLSHFDYAAEMGRTINGGRDGQIRIGVLPALTSGFLYDLLREFRGHYRNLRIVLYEDSPKDIWHRLALNQIDVLFTTGVPELSGYEVSPLWLEHVFMVLPTDHALASRDSIAWEDTMGERYIFSSTGSGPVMLAYVAERLKSLTVTPNFDVQEVSSDGITSLVSMGYGITVVSSSSIGGRRPGVVYRPMSTLDPISASMIWSRENSNPALGSLLTTVSKILRLRAHN